MSATFRASGYYKKYVESVAKDFKKIDNDAEKEYTIRNLVSRAYYTCLLHCREQHTKELNPTMLASSADSHKAIIDIITDEGVQSTLIALKKNRKYADYELVEFVYKNDDRSTIGDYKLVAGLVSELMNQVLKYKKKPSGTSCSSATPPTQNPTS